MAKKYRTGERSPSFPFYVRDFLTDVLPTSASTRGIWITNLCEMYLQDNRGVLERTVADLMRTCCATLDDVKRFFEENKRFKIANVTPCPENVRDLSADCPVVFQIVSRRMARAEKAKEAERLRKQEERKKGKKKKPVRKMSDECPESVAPLSGSPSSSSSFSSSNISKSTNVDLLSPDSKSDDEKKKPPRCPFKQLEALYNEICYPAGMKQHLTTTESHRDNMRPRWQKYPDVEFWRKEIFERAARSDFLCGKGSRGWKANLSFLVTRSKFEKLLAGEYDNSQMDFAIEKEKEPFDISAIASEIIRNIRAIGQGNKDALSERAREIVGSEFFNYRFIAETEKDMANRIRQAVNDYARGKK